MSNVNVKIKDFAETLAKDFKQNTATDKRQDDELAALKAKLGTEDPDKVKEWTESLGLIREDKPKLTTEEQKNKTRRWMT